MEGTTEDVKRVVLVTGGSSGIGRATAEAFARRGDRVVIAARTRRRAMEVVRTIELGGGEAYFLPTDVSQAHQVAALIEQTMDLYGRLDCAVNAAAVTDPHFAPTADLSEEEFDLMMGVTLKGTWLSMKHEIPAMLGGGGGVIVNVSSLSGLSGSPMASHYSAAKHGIIGLTRSAALEYAPRGIRINCVLPGATDTPMLRRVFEVMSPEDPAIQEEKQRQAIPMGRIGRPEEVARTILWLASEEGSYVTGAMLSVDGGLAAGRG